jgi:hypothetical protein
MTTPKRAVPRLFDIRNIIGALLGSYGVLLTVAGLAPGLVASHEGTTGAGNKVDLFIGSDANWWVGIALLVVAAFFLIWAALRPVVVDAAVPSDSHDK